MKKFYPALKYTILAVLFHILRVYISTEENFFDTILGFVVGVSEVCAVILAIVELFEMKNK